MPSNHAKSPISDIVCSRRRSKRLTQQLSALVLQHRQRDTSPCQKRLRVCLPSKFGPSWCAKHCVSHLEPGCSCGVDLHPARRTHIGQRHIWWLSSPVLRKRTFQMTPFCKRKGEAACVKRQQGCSTQSGHVHWGLPPTNSSRHATQSHEQPACLWHCISMQSHNRQPARALSFQSAAFLPSPTHHVAEPLVFPDDHTGGVLEEARHANLQ